MTTPAGWYDDSENPGQQRYWDGAQWTEHRQPVAPTPPPPPAPPQPPAASTATVAPVGVEKKSHTTRNVILAVIGVFVLLMGGCTIALVVAGGNAVNNAIDQASQDAQAPGGPNNPMEIEVGKAFEVQGFNYQAGWTVKNDFGTASIKGLKVQNNRSDKDSAIVEIKFWNGSEVLALVDCTSSPIDPGSTVTLTCFSGDKLPAQYEKVTINDTF